jgi:putative ABC transport system ATP-binding protein
VAGEDPIIRLVDVKKTYGEGKARQEVLRGVTLDIAKGELVALVGQSGSGKSTLLNIVGGLDRADAGQVVVAGYEYGKLDDSRLSRLRNDKIGFIFQSFHLLDHLTVAENVRLPGFFSPEGANGESRALDSLQRVAMRDYALRRPSELSGGQKQRVAIARALYARPTILLCDEPTGNLDSETGREVISFFQELNRDDGVTLLIVTHEERVSQAASRVLRIADGRLVAHEGRSVELPQSSSESEPAAS